jgi:hypothetical protein
VWWDGQGWSIHVEDAVDVGDQADAILAREDAACRVNGGYAIDAEPDPTARRAPGAHQGPRARLRPDRAPRPHAQARRSRSRHLGDLMYKYDQYDHAMVQARVEEFRDQTRRASPGS